MIMFNGNGSSLKHREKQSHKNKKTRSMVMVIVLLSSSLVSFHNLQMSASSPPFDGIHFKQGGNDAPQTSGDRICPSAARLFDKDELETFVKKARNFHQHGGNLASIENYLNAGIKDTLDRLDLGFEFDDDKNNQATKTTIGKEAVRNLDNYYNTHEVPRDGYGESLPGKWVGTNTKPLFGKDNRWINVIETDTNDRFKVGIGHVGPNCTRELRFSEGSYEGKIFCVPPQEEQQKDVVDDDCHIFSIGSNDQWGFEEDVVHKMPHCVTHTFDCTLKDNIPRKKPKTDRIRFYPYCISSSNNDHDTKQEKRQKFLPYHELWKATNITTPPKLLKIDVEGHEFGVIPDMFQNSPKAIWPEQIAMEVHWATRMVSVPSMLRTRTASEIALFFGILFHSGGYLPIQEKYFERCRTCLEVLLVRSVCP